MKSYDIWTGKEKELNTDNLTYYQDKKAKGKVNTDKNGYIIPEKANKTPKPTKRLVEKINKQLTPYNKNNISNLYELEYNANKYNLIYSIDFKTNKPIIYQCKNKRTYTRIRKILDSIVKINNQQKLLTEFKNTIKDLID